MQKSQRLLIIATVLSSILNSPLNAQNVTEYGPQQSKIEKTGSLAVSSDFRPYLGGVETKISSRGPTKFLGRVVVNFKINKNGSASDIKLIQSSGMAQIDTAAIDAVKNSAPFAALPADAGKSVDIKFSFEGTSKGSTGHAIRMR